MKSRAESLAEVSNTKYDLAIIGGGITGMGIALDGALRGLSVILLDKGDFASGTSSKSTKLIHGGLRYLKQFDFRLVNEVGRERAVIHKLATHLVHPDKMLLPIVKDGSYGKWITNLGLMVYDWLADVPSRDKRLMLDKDETLEKEPLLNPKDLEAGGFYAEYRTDDARLVMANARSAADNGAQLFNYTELTDFRYDDEGKLNGLEFLDRTTQKSHSISCKSIVNAAGPWTDKVRSLDAKVEGKHLFLTKGVHLVIDRKKLPIAHTVYFDNSDGRMLFAVPRVDKVYLGTTDTPFNKNLDQVLTTWEDAQYVLSAVNDMFPTAQLVLADVESSWAGLRPLIHEEGKAPGEMSRKDEIFLSESGLISITGGKLTGYRKMAERTLAYVYQALEQSTVAPRTKHFSLAGGTYSNYDEVLQQIAMLQEVHLEIDPNQIHKLVNNFGRDSEAILNTLDPKPNIQALLEAQVDWCVANEFVLHGLDFFERRTGMIYFDMPTLQTYKKPLLQALANALDWSVEVIQQEQDALEERISELTTFKNTNNV